MILVALLLAVTFPTELEGVRILPIKAATPACSTVSMGGVGRVSEWDHERLCPECIEGEASFGPQRDRLGKAFLEVAQEVRKHGGDTIHLEKVYRVDPGGTRVVRGRAYRCGTEAAGEGKR